MSAEKVVVGLDIGTTKVCAIVGRQNASGTIDVHAIGTADNEGVSRGAIDNIEKTVDAIRKAVGDAQRQCGGELNIVHVGIAGEHIRSQSHRGIITLAKSNEPEITQADVDRLREDMYTVSVTPGSEILHVIPQDYTVDTHTGVTDPVGMAGMRLEGNYLVVTHQIAAAHNIYRCVRKAGLEVAALVLQPLASSLSVLTEEELEAGVCLIDIGGGTSDLVIYENGIIRHTAVIPFGGNIITEDIKKGCSVMRKQAEQLKMQYGVALASEVTADEVISIAGMRERPVREIRRRTLASIIQARMEEIFEMAAREIRNAGYQHKLVGGIVVTGGGGQLANVADLVAYATGLDARVGYPADILAGGMAAEANHPRFATATGLLVYGLKYESVATPSDKPEVVTDVRRPTANSTEKPRRVPEIAPPPSGNIMNNIKAFFEKSIANGNSLVE